MSKPSYWKSSPGKKMIMGITGLIWAGFVLGHMVGNLLIFLGPESYNKYAYFLTSSNLLYVAEAMLVVSLLTHVGMAIWLTIENRQARGEERYAVLAQGGKSVSLASRTMFLQGSLILAFIITHLITFKFGPYYEVTVDGVVMRDLYRLVLEVFSSPVALVWYLVALILLGFHLSHGFGSTFQSLGLLTHGNRWFVKTLSWFYAVIVAGGFLSQPLYVFFIQSME